MLSSHAPSCFCFDGYTGNPATACHLVPRLPEKPVSEPCQPSPCGPYSQCWVVNGHAVCSCQANYIGSPPMCRPECMISADCPLDKACINTKCQDPCPGTCGLNARCQAVNHNPICSCSPGFTGDPFVRCLQEEKKPEPLPENPCVPSPCGPNSQCRVIGNTPACSCLPNFVGRAPNCRPECTINPECPGNLACQREKCVDPCPGSCGANTDCVVITHRPVCSCKTGFTGDPFAGCNFIQIVEPQIEEINPCNPSPCGANAVCKERNEVGSCTCLPEYFGDPYTGCRPECVTNSDCPRERACINNKCADPCPGTCGLNAECRVINHAPSCTCLPGYTGNPLTSCRLPPPPPEEPKGNPCQPSPCGPYSNCKVINDHAVCSCQTNYVGTPPACKPECMVSSECPQNKACINNKCKDPCPGTCGLNARCQAVNHNPICSCPQNYAGDPFVRCTLEEKKPEKPSGDPCVPSPCGPNSQCRVIGTQAACSCLPNYIGRAPNCRPECTINEECPGNLACQNERCKDPCPGSCGSFTSCVVIKHAPVCQCVSGYTGDPFTGCSIIPPSPPVTERPRNPCNPSPCGANAVCKERNGAGSCTCLPEYFGDPYTGCRPECVTNSDCDRSRACVNNKCVDPCPGTCGLNAECRVLNHAPSCTCIVGYTGDPARACLLIEPVIEPPQNPCQPSPCGPYSQCREINGHAVCSCNVGYTGSPPSCRPECVVSSECSQDKACVSQKCVDPCPGTCGLNAICRAVNHNPICSCSPGFTGEPFTRCTKIEIPPTPEEPGNPCVPSPCGPNSQCRQVGTQPACSCLPNFIGRPPNCRPECINDSECPNNLACKNEKCRDPCPGSCGVNAQCTVVNHSPACSCFTGYVGDPFSSCALPLPPSSERTPTSPCFPSPCGPNAECREKNGAGACICPPGYEGDPYDSNKGCHRECEVNTDCAPALACSSYKCVDPCPGTCGTLAECRVVNHVPTCTCPTGYTGDPFFQCKEIPPLPPPRPEDPCRPSPCGPNSQCRNVNTQAVCSCLPTYIGTPPNCRPECVVSSECPLDRACLNQKCADPCPNTCGLGAQCTTKNHNPICACPPGYTGDPFTVCSPQPIIEEPPQTERPPSCYPSPCGPNSQCKLVGDSPSCSCLPDFIGVPPNCRPECVLNTECNNQLSCINQRCKDPCPGSCGVNAGCHVINHLPICTCLEGHTGDPFTQCNLLPPVTTPPPPQDPCNPSPCGPNADCENGICTCVRDYIGNPYESCRPECVLSAECSRDKACIRNKCIDPCPGTCGQNARCDVINHIPTCSCPDGFTGDPFTNCRFAPEPPSTPKEPCNPSPCGPNSQCKNIDDHAVCSCIQGYQGSPPSCRPECLVSGECPQDKACVNQKCIDPCPGSCGLQARCEVRNHSPICSCREGQTGDPFQRCVDIPPAPEPRPAPINPCEPSPCGPNSICKPVGDSPSCTCQQNYIGNPPNCRPECVINPDCPSTEACINNKCRDPCPGSCGENAECHVVTHTVSCVCSPGFTGNPFVQCSIPKVEINPCEPSPCGANAECRQRNGAGACTCIQDYQGNPYEGCRPECVLSSDCPTNKACIRSKCADPCPGVCGQNAECSVINHVPACTCVQGYTGDPFVGCSPAPLPPVTEPSVIDPCSPSPCGLYSQCRNVNDQAVCSCLPDYTGSPPNCKPECVVSSECPQNRACHKFKCANPCVGTCGLQARCEVINHSPICTCPSGLTGDPFTRCYPLPPPPPPEKRLVVNPCIPSPCGPNSECRAVGEQPSCSCRPNYMGSPPNCRPECAVNTDCPSELACITEKCRDPCPGSCGFNTECRVQNHIPICTCSPGFTGDAFTECTKIEPPKIAPQPSDPCNPSPCGQNTRCEDGICSCLPLYNGDPYRGCRPECTMNTDCSPNKSCNNLRCIDPCPGTCGQGAVCDVINHIPTCSCPSGFEGDPFTNCRPIKKQVPQNPCQPSPCGPNSVCKVNNGVAVCSCQPGLIGTPPSCRPECVVSAECPLTQACLNTKCVDPCPGTCGINARCQVVNHNPICSCTQGNTGDPFTRCYPIPKEPPKPVNPCEPSPCGPNSICQVRGESPACSCLESYVGTPPNCRPECTINPECPNTRACVNQKCQDPCPGSCGSNAVCSVINHNSVCSCNPGFTGDPFRGCVPVPAPPVDITSPCIPSPCGANAVCKEQNNAGSCTCLPEYIGNPYEGCRPECVLNSDCPSNKACVRNKCQDPCPGTCGQNANCQVINHLPSCTCIPGFTGDPFTYCSQPPEPPKDLPPAKPCQPSPCGPNSQCREVNEQAVCSCLPNYIGSPPSCRPECVVSSECPLNRACVNQKCGDPCPGTCGLNAKCEVINHSPICSCSPGHTGDPFTRCYPIPPPPPEPLPPLRRDPCVPSPCGPNSQCRDIGGSPSCSCLQDYFGNPPNCRPECTINSECSSNLACIRQKCIDPCPGSCGFGAQCSVINHTPICTCPEGYTGDPFTNCVVQPPKPPPAQPDPCNPSPCGPNAVCNDGVCTCLLEYHGDPYRGCRPECVLSNDCPRDKACIQNKCRDPCPGTCGQNAECSVINHIPTCTCIQGYVGNAFVICNRIPDEEPKNPCNPSPCGPNSQCREVNNQAVCSCVPGFIGAPPTCRPECVTSQECLLSQACVNQKCIDPCPGTCGINALCQVVNHNPICSCQPRHTGDPFIRCLPIPEEPPVQINPCQPSPCGANAQCRAVGDSPSCSCLPEFIGSPPNCKPECVSNSECANHLACINQKCKDPCPGICGQNAECKVISHTPNCVCQAGYIGDPFSFCNLPVPTPHVRPTPCLPSPCGANAECTERNGAGACACLPDYTGNPYEGCRPECVLNSDCPSNKACVRNKCVDPCPGTCGQNALCQVVNHLPSCTCIVGYTGDPFRYCNLQEVETPQPPQNPCQPSPCGPNSQCREVNEQAVCSCLPNYIGSPPGCRPECVVSSECPQNKACVNQKCIDPCPGTCGLNANCQVINHSPICSCENGFTGDPFTRCYSVPEPPPVPPKAPTNPCVPSPCGPNSQCRDIGGSPSCSCLPNYIGNPPSCRPECTINPECPSNLACIQEKCKDPCPGSCGSGAQCSVINHTPICTCLEGYTGDPFTYCQLKPLETKPTIVDPCNPSPCGPNANCDNGICTCIAEYQGDPYRGCRPECILNNDCPRDKACIRNKCIDPCPGTCGQNAECAVINHIPTCSCIQGYVGNAFVLCTKIEEKIPKNPCNPTPCGPNSQCREINEQAVCSCVPGFIGSPPACRPECVSSSECPLNRACLNQKCIDPCPGTCGLSATCQVVNHNPICSCPPGQTGDPFTRCSPIREAPPVVPANPCQPSPCGPNAQCRVVGDAPSCSCLSEFIGTPPNCRPECISNSECANHLACINLKCKDPCPGSCGLNAECRVVSHTPNCVCLEGFIGNPFIQCQQKIEIPPVERPTPCVPSPCGANAECREQNGAGSCSCVADYIGNPYEGCRPECTLNSDCPSNKACIRNKCMDPCPGTCGQNAECQVINHLPSCTCIPGYTGDPFSYCSIPPPTEPSVVEPVCEPNPCGPNSQCREVNSQAVCSCLPNYTGSPPGCRPECVVSSECAQDRACVNQKCVDPCPGTCGLNAECQVINHSPICSCKATHTGDPFTRCYLLPPPPEIPPLPVVNPCIPSPCGPNSQCRDVGGSPSCSCLSNYIGSPPNCRPECTINSECPSNLACIREKCIDPCPGSCGASAQCSVINHTPICTCPEGYTGDPFSYCQPKPPEIAPPEPDPCNPSPCGPNTRCDNGICTCLAEYQGDPYRGCRPECVLNSDCSRELACIRNKCQDPCPGTCGQNAQCAVINHIPTCACNEGFRGNAFVLCTRIPDETPKNPCTPTPCGPNSQCREFNGQAVCSCVPGFIGSPPTCRPECVTSTECSLSQACVNQKCIDPCPGTCGLNARCQVVNHNPICSCPTKYTGDPFTRCLPIEEKPVPQINPCQPSPCGPNAQCKEINESPSCSCLQEFIGAPPNCRPECVSNSECASHLACINQKCRDPCPGICGQNAECRVVSHTPNCVCLQGFVGNPFAQCIQETPKLPDVTHPCFPSPCGANAECREQNGAGSCTCIQDYLGNPYEGCRPECVLNSDCPSNKACVRNKCEDPCPGTCGQNADCQVINHLPSCTCFSGYTGDPFRFCNVVSVPEPPLPTEPCQPNPCGPNSQCREVNNQAVCSCLPNYIGSPPGCRPECTVSSECSLDKACVNQKCVDPCPGTCGLNARCNVINHSPICSCQQEYTGDPFTRCYQIPPPPPEPTPPRIVNPCVPSPCGPHSICQDINGAPSCSCTANYIGTPPNCRPECTINAECSSNLACIREKCRDPCPGSCGAGAQCAVINHTPSCTCPEGYTGDPFTYCTVKPLPPAKAPEDPCNPSPCGPNARCNNGICTCIPEYQGDPYVGCKPECVLNTDCPRDKACIRNKCTDPCPGTCGQNAECTVINHIPTCSCIQDYVGNAFVLCQKTPAPLPKNPCNPSPCGPNSQCREINDQAVCSCVPGYIGSPPTCRPECVTSTECSLDRACINQKCIDPCPGTCGINGRCQVVNHNPICSCPPRYTGDPFVRCIVEEPPSIPTNPCQPSPCGPNSQCREINGAPSCSCLNEFIGTPPNCRPECVSNSECANHLACINQKCKDPCPGICGLNAECRVVSHTPNCVCMTGYSGNPFQQCTVYEIPTPPPADQINPCFPSPCGANAICKERNNAGSCVCLPEYIGNPYEGCRPECVLNSDCPSNRACINNKCVDPCPGTCGQNAECQVINHLPTCSCVPGYTGDPFRFCNFIPPDVIPPEPSKPCQPSPCGPNSQCREVNGQAVCSCLPDYIGSPPGCRPECTVSSECAQNRACINQKCADPCPGTCGLQARCEVINHSPICSCSPGYTGDAFTRCYSIPPPEPTPTPSVVNPCVPSPCGPNSQCRDLGGTPSCSCLLNYVGNPPNCRPECTINSECSSNLACINEKCKDPCPGSCGIGAICEVRNHNPVCFCPPGYAGDAFISCVPKPPPTPPKVRDLCYPNPCGSNARCDNGTCSCFPEYQGDPYRECRPECVLNSDCPRDRACINQKCRDPCPGTCGQNAECTVFNHYPSCSCLEGFTGDAFLICSRIMTPPPKNPCNPSPCGPNSQCREVNGQSVCSCLQGYIGSPPTCRPECVSSYECALNRACVNQKCIDPCPGTCGLNALCQVVNHNPICTCPVKYTGDPFTRCQIIIEPQQVENPCVPSPCGPNAQCEPTPSGTAKCTCLANYVGAPPNCRPECVTSNECPKNLACINLRCGDPCPGSCGLNARCLVVNHVPNCLCVDDYVGDPFTICTPKPPTPTPPRVPKDPCYPSPCGPNAHCRVENTYAICECLPEYHGNPYESCRPECLTNADCPMNRACISNKCQDPCPGTCGVNALCSVTNHIPVCSCPEKYEGDAFRICTLVTEPPPSDPCNPSPCGINTICRKSGDNAICECLPGFFGTPTASGCKPECTISADCARDKACVNTKCVDPCPGVCGFGAICHVINHSPVCSCPPPLLGDPFTLCQEQPKKPEDPCNPSPCNLNGQCRVVNGVATCIYPECVINQDCPRDKACYSQKCRDPCKDACGLNALCQAVNHKAICSCPSGYVGSPEVHCVIPQEPKPKVECVQDSECTNDKACINNRCINPCSASSGICGQNANCHPQLHRAVCSCRDGFTGNAQQACYEIGCRSDSDCPPTQACINKDCIDPCSFTSCGTNAICRADANHRARCYCLDNYRGDPLVRCERPECTVDEECPYNLACRNERCEDPCNCGTQAICRVNNHRAQCSCPPGYTGNPLVNCVKEPEPQPQCTMDSDCPSRLACFNGVCKNPCYETKPCGRNAECIVVDSLPLRTMSCMCLPGYVGDADTECKLVPEDQGCKSDNECSSSETCLNRQCVNPCTVGNPCAPSAECQPTNHKATCRCATGLIGNPFIKCYRELPTTKPECTADSECNNDQACINQRCQDPCILTSPCGTNSLCRTSFHRPTCLCREGWVGNPQVVCYKPECSSDDDCPYNKACINENCINPCASRTCGRGAECLVQNHRAQCQCPAGTQGDPLLSCITGICHYNEDCADHEACDHLNRVCRPVCDDDTCAETATCVGEQHQPKCRCPAGSTGNPFIQCIGMLPGPEPEPACRSDSECPSQQACINQYCVNPCASGNMCNQDQECRVLDTLPLRTVMCQCPADTIVDPFGRCSPVKIQPQCQVDSDCSDTDKCIRGSCIEACRVDGCGVNAICNSLNHLSVCSCASGYTGNAHVECYQISIKPIPLPLPPECYDDSDCTYDKGCRGGHCVNPCREDKPCASNAFCSVNNHVAVCKCPAGYIGNPEIDCIAPPGPTVGCTSNSECPRSESCINHLCVSPCNCGPNAECKVVNHYATCFCKPGYSGNPQTGCVKLGCQSDNECGNDKQCYNGQCINPCILGDPCARNAECYGNNHRAACRCPEGYEGNPFDRCERVECHTDIDCPNNRACLQQRCVDPCSNIANPPCAQNAICYAQNHAAGCVCPSHLPEGNPQSYCTAPQKPAGKAECELDIDCPSKLACIRNQCVNPCEAISPCHATAHCSVLDTVPVRTMICTCPEGWVPNENGECHAVVVPIPPGCTSDDDCSNNEACINRLCRSPCDCGSNADCQVQNHRAICSCRQGYEGNPNIACHSVGCRIDSECPSGKACINGNCINPCLVKDPCGFNAECYVYQNRAECRCLSGYRGNPYDRCIVVGCTSNSDCPNDRQCINAQCINPCVYDNPCSSRAECQVQNHLPLCRCPPGLIGNPYVDCRPEPQPECREDSDCPSRLACLSNKCQDPCAILEPCHRPAECQVVGTVPLRTMICVCPPGYISSGSGTCQPVPAVKDVACTSDSECPKDKACFNGLCRSPCNCGPNSECRIRDHKPVCSCRQGFEGNPEIECHRVGCRNDDECSGQHSCVNRQCVPVCAADGSTCGDKATCYGYNHRAICDCPPGLMGNPHVACVLVGCRSDSECPGNRACINNKCELPCETANPCDGPAECKVYNHIVECVCPPGTVSDGKTGCSKVDQKCRKDHDCPSHHACIGGECVNPCKSTQPCGVNAECTVLDTEPVRTMICQCPPGYQGNAAVQCDMMTPCRIDKGLIRGPDGKCVCMPNRALNENDECVPCLIEKGFKIDERGRCVCALERKFIIDERGECVCPTQQGYELDYQGNCVPNGHTNYRFTTPMSRPDLMVSCLSDGVQVEITLAGNDMDSILYVKGHSKDENCRRMISVGQETKIELFKVKFGTCGLIHINGEASFVLVIQNHPKLLTRKSKAYHIKCVYQTGEQNVTLGFNVSMLTTAGTIANTGPPPTCLMKIVTPTGQEINSAEIGDNLMLQVDVQPGSIYGGFARSCVAKTMEDSVENEYLVTDENGCATDPTIFGEWEYNPDTQSLLASFNAFKFPSSDNIRFQCNIRVCFGKCQPVNCRGYNAFGRRKRAIDSENNTDVALGGDLLSGQMREEITIQSNAIFTIEKREERGPGPQTAPNSQKLEDICVSMIEFIIGLVITALLALVAVAVAVSCWLMAIRRRPKATGPLPHPPEFPNPLFTTPEPMAEPSPDYLT